MSYTAVEAKVQDLIQGLPRFTGHPERVTLQDYNILDNGVDEAVIIEPGGLLLSEPERYVLDKADSDRASEQDVIILPFSRFDQYGKPAGFASLRDDLVALVENYPDLDGLTDGDMYKVEFVSLTSIGDPEDSPNGAFLYQALRARYRLHREVTEGTGDY